MAKKLSARADAAGVSSQAARKRLGKSLKRKETDMGHSTGNILIEHDLATGYALLKREGENVPLPYVAAYAYDESDGTWGQGHYFADLDEALGYFRAKTRPLSGKSQHRNLQRLRREAGYRCAADAAQAIGVERAVYESWERCPDDPEQTRIPLSFAWKVADKFGVTIDEVVGRVELRDI